MNIRINQIVKSLLQKETLEQCSLQELQSFADSNPHFGAAQLLLTKKIKSEKPDLYNEHLQKTFLYFHNPLWVEQLMNDTGNATIIAAPPEPVTSQPVEEIINQPQPKITEPTAEQTINAGQVISETVGTTVETDPVLEYNNVAPVVTNIEGAKISEPLPTAEVQEKEIAIPSLAAAALQLRTEPANSTLSFEPYHTVDYFASQGIKFRQEEKPVDKFGQQLKSFTDWLKVLRTTPVSAISQNITPVAEKKVEQLAETSIQEKDVITEAMAEVWAKQGNAQKAIELYTKLSLQEPAKSSYFAALIEDLKKNI